MEKLDLPVAAYTSGKLPSHASSSKLAHNFNVPASVVVDCLVHFGMLDRPTASITDKAKNEGVVDLCTHSGTYLWKVDAVLQLLRDAGIKADRVYANQQIKKSREPQFVTLGDIAVHFNVSAIIVGRWLDELGYRTKKKLPNNRALDSGLAKVITFDTVDNEGKKSHRRMGKWEFGRTLEILRDAGHPLDFDYRKSLQATGKNSAVTVTSVDARAYDAAREFQALFSSGDKDACVRLVRKTPRVILQRMEKMLSVSAGFLTDGEFTNEF